MKNCTTTNTTHPKIEENPIANFLPAKEIVLETCNVELQLPNLSSKSESLEYCRKIFLLSIDVGAKTRDPAMTNSVMLFALALSRFNFNFYGSTPLTPIFLKNVCGA